MAFSFLPHENCARQDFQVGRYVKDNVKYENIPQLLELEDGLQTLVKCLCTQCKRVLDNVVSKNESRPCATIFAAQFVSCALKYLLGKKNPKSDWRYKMSKVKCYQEGFRLLKDISEESLPTKGLELSLNPNYSRHFKKQYKLGKEDREKLMVLMVCNNVFTYNSKYIFSCRKSMKHLVLLVLHSVQRENLSVFQMIWRRKEEREQGWVKKCCWMQKTLQLLSWSKLTVNNKFSALQPINAMWWFENENVCHVKSVWLSAMVASITIT